MFEIQCIFQTGEKSQSDCGGWCLKWTIQIRVSLMSLALCNDSPGDRGRRMQSLWLVCINKYANLICEKKQRPSHGLTSQETRNAEPMLIQCWPRVEDSGPTLNQHRFNVPRTDWLPRAGDWMLPAHKFWLKVQPTTGHDRPAFTRRFANGSW